MARSHAERRVKRKPKPAPKPKPPRPGNEVRVRMYCQGVGDCYLLSFPAAGNKTFHMLIDCGVLMGTPGDRDLMKTVVGSVREECRGRLDLVAVTHEHWDHLSGFVDARGEFEKFNSIDRLWLAWTEDPHDALAGALREKRERARARLHAALDRMPQGARLGLDRVAEFFGARGDPERTTTAALDWLRGRVPEARTEYHRPGGRPRGLPGVEGVRVYVLGPPRDEDFLKHDLATKKEAREHEVYELFLGSFQEDFFAAALEAGAGGLPPVCPFDLSRAGYRTAEQARQDLFFRGHYFGSDGDDALAWRRIDHDWLGAAEGLALKLDSDTNNTSLALAIELLPSGRVLLFVGDAQVGNWQSWHEQTWTVTDEAGKRTVTADELLARTVLYKVGHHGSHNATLRKRGLERMTSPELVAMLPVNQEVAHRRGWNRMPLESLVEALRQRTGGRVLRSDQKTDPGPYGKRLKVNENEMFVEYAVPMG
ncbi:MAG TPA: hypothetical protein VIL46_09245 [Gemmataceae bacterium]